MLANPIDYYYRSALVKTEEAIQRRIVKARNYHAGIQPVYLTDRQKEYINVKDGEIFRLNVCKMIVLALAQRMILSGWRSLSSEKSDQVWLDALYQNDKIAQKQSEAHEIGVRDGEAAVLVGWDSENQRPTLVPHTRYTDTANGGDGYGVRIFYANDDPSQPMIRAVKQWSEDMGGRIYQRRTDYYPDRIEKYRFESGWQQFSDPEDSGWPISWLMPDGKPIGVPAGHFINPGFEPEAAQAWPIQDGINKAMVDLLAAGDTAGFRLLAAFGWIPTTDGKPLAQDGSNQLKFNPGSIVGSSSADGSLTAIEAGNLSALLDMKQALMIDSAIVTQTPTAAFVTTRQVASEGTLKEQNAPLLAKLGPRQVDYGAAWSQAAQIARRVAVAYGAGEGVDTESGVLAVWKAQPRSAAEVEADIKVKRETGVPLETLWGELGYTADQVEAMKNTAEYKARLALMTVATDAE